MASDLPQTSSESGIGGKHRREQCDKRILLGALHLRCKLFEPSKEFEPIPDNMKMIGKCLPSKFRLLLG